MVDSLFTVGTKLGLGIFFFLFVVLGAMFWLQNKSIMKENLQRENRYISTIDKLADVHDVKMEITELRKDVNEGNERQEQMIGRVLDRLPPQK